MHPICALYIHHSSKIHVKMDVTLMKQCSCSLISKVCQILEHFSEIFHCAKTLFMLGVWQINKKREFRQYFRNTMYFKRGKKTNMLSVRLCMHVLWMTSTANFGNCLPMLKSGRHTAAYILEQGFIINAMSLECITFHKIRKILLQ